VALRGYPVRNDWMGEGNEEFSAWAMTLEVTLSSMPLMPIGSFAEERAQAGQRLAELEKKASEIESDEDAEETLDELLEPERPGVSEGEEDEFVRQFLLMSARAEPLTDREIEQLGDRYQQYLDFAYSAMNMDRSELVADAQTHLFMVGAVRMIGILRSADPEAATAIIRVLKTAGDMDFVAGEAEWVLEQMGPAALEPVFNAARYTTRHDVLDILLRVLGVVGRGNDEVYRFLHQRYRDTPWERDKFLYADALGLSHAPRAVPLLVQALREPDLAEENIETVLDALMELDPTMQVDPATGDVTISGYGTFTGVAPAEWIASLEATEDVDDGGEFDEGDLDLELEDLEDITLDDLDAEDTEEDDEGDLPAKGPAPFQPPHVQHVGRNDPCPCGSGKKYKHCHGKNI
jgi:hypothetical protein